MRIRLPDGVRPAAGWPSGRARRPAPRRGPRRRPGAPPRASPGAPPLGARRRISPRPATGTGAGRPAAVASAAAATAPRREAARRGEDPREAGADQRRAPRPAPPAATGPRPPSAAPGASGCRSTIRAPGGQLARRLDGAVAQRPPADAGRRQRRRPRGVPGRPDRIGPPASARTRPAGPSRRAGTPGALERRAGRAGCASRRCGPPASSAVRASGSPARAASWRMSEADGERGHQAQHATPDQRRRRGPSARARVGGGRSACSAGLRPVRAKVLPSPRSDRPGGEIGGVE